MHCVEGFSKTYIIKLDMYGNFQAIEPTWNHIYIFGDFWNIEHGSFAPLRTTDSPNFQNCVVVL